MKLSKEIVLDKLRYIVDCGNDDFISPTHLGAMLGIEYATASSRLSPILKRLVEEGFVERNKQGRYRYCG